MPTKTIQTLVLVENGSIRYIDENSRKEMGIYETYFIDKETSLNDIVDYTLALKKEQMSDAVGPSEIVILEDGDSSSQTLALISI